MTTNAPQFDLAALTQQLLSEAPEDVVLAGTEIVFEAKRLFGGTTEDRDKALELVRALETSVLRALSAHEQGKPKINALLTVLLARFKAFPEIEFSEKLVQHVVLFYSPAQPQATGMVVSLLGHLNQMALLGPIVLAGLSCKEHHELEQAIKRANECPLNPFEYLGALRLAFKLNAASRYDGDGSRNGPMELLIDAIIRLAVKIPADAWPEYEWRTLLGEFSFFVKDGNSGVRSHAERACQAIRNHLTPKPANPA